MFRHLKPSLAIIVLISIARSVFADDNPIYGYWTCQTVGGISDTTPCAPPKPGLDLRFTAAGADAVVRWNGGTVTDEPLWAFYEVTKTGNGYDVTVTVINPDGTQQHDVTFHVSADRNHLTNIAGDKAEYIRSSKPTHAGEHPIFGYCKNPKVGHLSHGSIEYECPSRVNPW